MLRISIRRSHAAKLAVVALGGCVALTACGPVQLGAAAIVGGQRITTSTLTTQVADLTAAYQAEKHKVQLDYAASQAPQEVLAWLIVFRVGQEMASRQHITLTTAQIQQAISTLSAEVKQSGGTTLTEAAIAHGVPPDLISTQFGTYEAVQTALISRLSRGQTSQAAQQAVQAEFNKDQCLAAKSLNIKINPQFGRLDYSSFAIVAAPNTLSAPGPGPKPSASPSSTPEYSPSC